MATKADWKIQMPASELLKFAEAKLDHHTNRLAYWRGRQDDASKKLRAEGVQFRDNDARYRNTSVAVGIDVVVDPQLSRELSEVNGKVDQHSGLTTTYHEWVAFLTRAGDALLQVDFDAFNFFSVDREATS